MDILKSISNCIVEMNEDDIESYIDRAINEEKVEIKDIYSKGLNSGMVRAIELYEQKSYDLPEVIVCAEVLNKGLKIIESYGSIDDEEKPKVLLAVVEGDTHEIGKNIVKIMFEAAGFDVIDMGVNRNMDDVLQVAVSEQVDIIGLSSMMTTTRGEMQKLIEKLDAMNLAKRPKVLIGGGSITEIYAREIKADGYAPNAPIAVKMVKEIIEEAM